MASPEIYMREALSLARKGLLTTRPNPMVGCVITHNDKIIGRGWHKRSGENHAEINAIQDVINNHGETEAEMLLKESDMYVTLEPCSSTGKTPPCSATIKKYGIQKVYIASEDNSQNGFAKKEKEIEIIEGLLRDEARELNRGFFSRIEKNKPFITAKIAMGLDGGIALSNGESKWITSDFARQDSHKLRAENDAILTGIGTILLDNPSLTVRNSGYDKNEVLQPLRVVIDRNSQLKGDESIFSSKGKNLIFSASKKNFNDSNTEVLPITNKSREGLLEVMSYLAKNKLINNLMIESGQGIFDAMISEELIDEIVIYQAPKLLGKNRKTFSNINESLEKLSTIDLEVKEILNLGKEKKIVLTPNYH